MSTESTKLVQRPYIYVSFSTSAGSGANSFTINGSTSNTYLENQSSGRPISRPVSRWMSKNPSFGPLGFPLKKLIIQTGSKLHFFASETKNGKITFLGGKHGIEQIQRSLVVICEIYKVRQIPATIFVQLPIRFYHDL